MHTPRLLCACWSLMGSVIPAHANTLFYDGFDYAPGEDALTASVYWSSVRNPGAEADIVEGSLTYRDASGFELRTSGATALIDTAEESAEVRHRAVLDLGAHEGAELWVSLLGHQVEGDGRRFINLVFMAPDNTVSPPDRDADDDEVFALGVSSSPNPSGWSLYNRSLNNGRQVAMSLVPTSQPSLLVGRVEPNVDGGEADRYTFWVNPPLGQAPSAESGWSFVSTDAQGAFSSDFSGWSDLIAVRLGAGTASGDAPAASWLVDEVRVGPTWADVLPWSPPLEYVDPMPVPHPNGWVVTWRPAPERVDVVQSSTDLKVWMPFPESRHVGMVGETSASFSVPAPPVGTSAFYVRVFREPQAR